MQAVTALRDIVRAFDVSVGLNSTGPLDQDVYQEALQGLATIDELYNMLINGLAAARGVDLMPVAYSVTQITDDQPLTAVSGVLLMLLEAVEQYYLHFMCHRLVRLCDIPNDTPESLRIEELSDPALDPFRQREPDAACITGLENMGLLREQLEDRIGSVNKQLLQLWGFVSNGIAVLEGAMPLGSNGFWTELHINPETVKLPSLESSKKKAMALLKNYLLGRALRSGLRKQQATDEYGNPTETYIMTPKFTPAGIPTGSYKRAMALTQWIGTSLTHSTAPPVIKEIIAGQEAYVINEMAKTLACVVSNQLPLSIPNPRLYAYRNGVFDMGVMSFVPYLGNVELQEIARADTSGMTRDEQDELQEYADALNARVENCSDEDLADTARINKAEPRLYVDEEFDQTWLTIPLEELEPEPLRQILEYQGLSYEVRIQISALLGRALFPRKYSKDTWTVAPYFVGCAGTGKSTIIETVAKLVRNEEVAVMEANMEDQFGLMNMIDRPLVIATECPKNAPLSQILKAITGERLSIARKGIGAANVEDLGAQFLFGGNEFFVGKNNAAGQGSRRFVIVSFDHVVRARDNAIVCQLRSSMGRLHVFLARCYSLLANAHGKKDFYTFCDQYFITQMDARFIMSNPLAGFICDASLFERTPPGSSFDYYMDWKEFVDIVSKAGSKLGVKIAMRNTDDYQAIFDTLKLRTAGGEKYDYKESRMRTSKWVVGLCATENVQQMKNELAGR